MFDPALWIGSLVLFAIPVISAAMGLQLLFATERGDVRRAHWRRVQLAVRLALAQH